MTERISRRNFLKAAGKATLGAVALGSVATSESCSGGKRVETSQTPEGEMATRIDPKTGAKVSLLGYGCMRWPMTKDSEGNDAVYQEVVNELVDYAMQHGVNYFDTAPVYLQGQSEHALGLALSRYPRNSYHIATKMSNSRVFTRKYAMDMYKGSFEALRTDRIDYYLLHAIGGGSGVKGFEERYIQNGVLDFLLRERENGRIINLGFSFHGSKEDFDLFTALHDKYHWDFVQIEMNYLDWRHAKTPKNVNAEYLYDELDKREIPITVMEPLLGGRLASLPEGIAEKLKEREPEQSIASWAFRFCGSYPRVLTILSGMTSMEPLMDNIRTFSNFKPLSEEERSYLLSVADLLDTYPMVGCTGCQYCMPCPYGINIPGIFRHYNRCVSEASLAQSTGQRDYRKLKRRYLVSYDRALETYRQADHCIGCGQCEPFCPQGIEIPRQLRRIASYVENLRQDVL